MLLRRSFHLYLNLLHSFLVIAEKHEPHYRDDKSPNRGDWHWCSETALCRISREFDLFTNLVVNGQKPKHENNIFKVQMLSWYLSNVKFIVLRVEYGIYKYLYNNELASFRSGLTQCFCFENIRTNNQLW